MSQVRRNLFFSFAGEFASRVPLYLVEVVLMSRLSIVNYGLWTGLQTLLRSLPYLHFGGLNALRKWSPVYEGKGDRASVEKLERSVFGIMLLSGLTFFIAVGLGWPLLEKAGLAPDALGFREFLCIGLIGILLQGYTYYQAKFVTELRMGRYTAGLLVYAFSYFAFVYFSAEQFQIPGALASMAVAYVLALLIYLPGEAIRPNLDKREMKNALSLGGAPFILTVSIYGFQLAERLAIQVSTPLEILALYGFAFSLSQILVLTAHAVGQVVSTLQFRASGGGDASSGKRISISSMWMLACVGAVGWFVYASLGELAISRFFPKYSEAYLPVRTMLLGTSFAVTASPLIGYLMSLHKERPLISLHLALSLGYFAALSLALRLEPGFHTAAQVILAGQFVYFLSMTASYFRSEKTAAFPWAAFISTIIFLSAPLAGAVLIFHGLSWTVAGGFVEQAGRWLTLLAFVLCFLGLALRLRPLVVSRIERGA